MRKALIYLDSQDRKQSAQLLEVIRRIYGDGGAKTYAAAFGGNLEAIKGFFDEVHQFQMPDGCAYDMRLKASYIKQLHDKESFSCIVIPATFEGRMMAPILAVKLQTGLVADVTEVTGEDGSVRMVRPAFDGKLMAVIENEDSDIVMMSARLSAFQYKQARIRDTKIVYHTPDIEGEPPIKVIAEGRKQSTEDIRDAEILVSGGGGVMERFPSLHQLAEPLHAMVASSRRLVDSGITPRSIQVGQSGKTVSPRLYIALGIYGSLQHIEGLDHVEDIISVNINRNAPICSLSSIVVEGDAIEFIEKLSTKIKKEKEKQL
ncbi:electron transfer flavoprotein subunit alpha/FixB family protein [Dorea sp. D27]|uniref:electron transfer flavoprotein subunit alpha/FixB family protein n=1 Tax=Dorea sp. D27 TaxID=658665 RepID=UPI0006732623|nr:electron transfer flavoprotein subunit alpha/FixB family protein [Dorea sp. D27]KMZ53797.1 electron transfer flavoprotein, alpha subunit [Dorea sp. D27]